MDVLWPVVFPPMALQFAAYFALARGGFRVTTRRAALMAALRVVLGVILFFGLMSATLEQAPYFGVLFGVSSLFAWTGVAFLDPSRSPRRLAVWVCSGTVVSMIVNEAYWRVVLGQSMLIQRAIW